MTSATEPTQPPQAAAARALATPAQPASLSRSLVAHPSYGPLPALLVLLTAVTGVVDAVSILSLGRVFVANMTGNVVFAGFALVGAPGFSLSASLFALAGFLAGAALGGHLIARAGRDRGVLLREGVAIELLLAVIALILAATSGGPGVSHGTLGMNHSAFTPGVIDALAALLAVAMGVQNAVARRLAVPDMTTTVLTMTLTGIGADVRAMIDGGPARATARVALDRRLLSIATMLAGAISAGYLVLHVSPLSALILAASLLAVAAMGTAIAASRPADWRTPAKLRRAPDLGRGLNNKAQLGDLVFEAERVAFDGRGEPALR
jgi:uncharacterized membrane protein YoaK (UPF0700 family)